MSADGLIPGTPPRSSRPAIIAEDDPDVVTALDAFHQHGDRLPWWNLLRSRGPVVHWRGQYILVGHDEVLAALRSPAFQKPIRMPFAEFLGEEPLFADVGDNNRFRRYRRIMNPAFNRDPVADLNGALRHQAGAVVDSIADTGRCEAINGVAYPFTARALLTFLGFPPSDEKRFNQIMTQLAEGGVNLESRRELFTYVKNALSTRPRLAQVIDSGEHLDDSELIGCHGLAFFAGFEPTAAAMGFALYELARRPAMRSQIRGNPALIPAFVDEVLRVHGGGAGLRYLPKPVTISGFTVPRGLVILLLGPLSVAEHEQIELPDEGQSRPPNWAFGAGRHRCLGAHLALAELRILVEEWLKRIPQFDLPPDFAPQLQLRGTRTETLAALPLRWDTGRPRRAQ